MKYNFLKLHVSLNFSDNWMLYSPKHIRRESLPNNLFVSFVYHKWYGIKKEFQCVFSGNVLRCNYYNFCVKLFLVYLRVLQSYSIINKMDLWLKLGENLLREKWSKKLQNERMYNKPSMPGCNYMFIDVYDHINTRGNLTIWCLMKLPQSYAIKEVGASNMNT